MDGRLATTAITTITGRTAGARKTERRNLIAQGIPLRKLGQLQPGVFAKHVGLVGLLPGELGFVATKMAIDCGLLEDRSPQIEGLDDLSRGKRKMRAD